MLLWGVSVHMRTSIKRPHCVAQLLNTRNKQNTNYRPAMAWWEQTIEIVPILTSTTQIYRTTFVISEP